MLLCVCTVEENVFLHSQIRFLDKVGITRGRICGKGGSYRDPAPPSCFTAKCPTHGRKMDLTTSTVIYASLWRPIVITVFETTTLFAFH